MELRMEKKEETYLAGTMRLPFGVTIVDENETDKLVTKRYPDDRTLTMVVVGGLVVEKHMTYKMLWDHAAMKNEREKGVNDVSFKYWEKDGLSVNKSYYGTYLIGLMVSLDYALVTNGKVKCEILEDEIEYDIAFPMVNVKTVTMEDGFSPDQKENPTLGAIMLERVVRALNKFANDDKDEAADDQELADRKRKAEEVLDPCEFCGEKPCVWITERDAVIANDENQHGHLLTVLNRTRRKIAFRHMFHVTNGGYGQKGVRKQHAECVEGGVRALFPDAVHMGFKEE
jgi:hypothetical protein